MARQTPAPNEIYLDHVGWFVPDIEKAGAAAFERLGFVLTPFVAHHNVDPVTGASQPFGTGNRCAMLRLGYLEILAAIEGADTQLARELRAGVARYTGVHLLAFSVHDIDAAHAHLEREGFEPLVPVHLRRPVKNESGGDNVASFSVLRPPTGRMPEGRIQMLTQETPDLVWQSSLITRVNHITALSSVLLCVEDPLEAAGRYGRFVGRKPITSADYATLALDRGRLAFATPERTSALLPGVPPLAAPSMIAVGLIADDVNAARQFCVEHRIDIAFDQGDRFCIGPIDAMGAAIVVHAERGVWPPNPR